METERLAAPENTTGLASFIQRHQSALWRYLRLLGADPDAADDLMQETFLRVLTGKVRRIEFRYLRTVARSLFLDRIRYERRRATILTWAQSVDECVARSPSTLEDEYLAALRTCLARLSGRGREALELRHGYGQSQEAISGELGLGVDGVKSLLRRSRGILRDCIEQKLSEHAAGEPLPDR